MPTQYRCKNERRRITVQNQTKNGQPILNGIDYLEVLADQKTLVVYLLHPLRVVGEALSEDNIQILGGTRIQSLVVESVSANANVLTVRASEVGDYSRYTLRLVNSTFSSGFSGDAEPPEGFDPQLAQVEFSFWVEGFSEFDCQSVVLPPEIEIPPPVIDYLAKDYASFRQLMLDRLSETMPKWIQRNPADMGIMLVELLAYTGDYLSYYQDAVATEAYLGTARKRVSVRRHARLLDYFIHDGCNARTWVVINLDSSFEALFQPARASSEILGITLLGPSLEKNRPGVKLLTHSIFDGGALSIEKFQDALNANAQVFETLHDVTLYSCLNTLYFYTWEDEQCCLPQGSTQATLKDSSRSENGERSLQKILKPGSVLAFEEVKGPTSGCGRDADCTHRHVVRLTKVIAANDPLNGELILKIRWDVEDALPFDLQISNVSAQGQSITNISVARGNVVLADAGCTVPKPESHSAHRIGWEELEKQLEALWKDSGWQRQKPRPRLQAGPLTQQGYVYSQQNQWVHFESEKSASAAMKWKLRDARPAIAIWEDNPPSSTQEAGPRWEAQQDLLVSDRFARHFIVETEEDGKVYLRFGDDTLGKQPSRDTHLYATYRIGNGSSGNVGAESITGILILPENLEESIRSRIASQDSLENFLKMIQRVYNPLPAQGGVDPEPIEQIRLYAPQAFREQRRAVTTADYAERVKQFPGVQNAIADRRWTGSWHTIFITVDREGGRAIDEDFKQQLLAFLEEFRLTGHDLEIENPRFVPLDIAIAVKVEPGYFRSAVEKALLNVFSKQMLANGQQGFFHPDNFSFGQPVYLSQVIFSAKAVAGVASVDVTRFKRWLDLEEQGRRALETGQIAVEPLEIVQLDNDPSSPENGRIEFQLEGGL